MANKSVNKKIILNRKNSKRVEAETMKLNDSTCKLSMSDFVNQSLEVFLSKYYKKEHSAFESQFFDRKKLLQKMIQEDDIHSFKASLKELQNKVGNKKVASLIDSKEKTDEIN